MASVVLLEQYQMEQERCRAWSFHLCELNWQAAAGKWLSTVGTPHRPAQVPSAWHQNRSRQPVLKPSRWFPQGERNGCEHGHGQEEPEQGSPVRGWRQT